MLSLPVSQFALSPGDGEVLGSSVRGRGLHDLHQGRHVLLRLLLIVREEVHGSLVVGPQLLHLHMI